MALNKNNQTIISNLEMVQEKCDSLKEYVKSGKSSHEDIMASTAMIDLELKMIQVHAFAAINQTLVDIGAMLCAKLDRIESRLEN